MDYSVLYFFGFQNKLKCRQLFSVLKCGSLLEYALFCAKRVSVEFCNVLYASLYFIHFCPLKIAQKFELLICMSEQILKCNLTNLYE